LFSSPTALAPFSVLAIGGDNACGPDRLLYLEQIFPREVIRFTIDTRGDEDVRCSLTLDILELALFECLPAGSNDRNRCHTDQNSQCSQSSPDFRTRQVSDRGAQPRDLSSKSQAKAHRHSPLSKGP
jgi:hypothetical protein